MSAPTPLARLTMVQSAEITNFRGFEVFEVTGLKLVNVIVGDNGVGKTAFLEALHLAASGNGQRALALKQWRGSTAGYTTGVASSVVEGVFNDLFHDPASNQPIVITLTGKGVENRKLVIDKRRGDVIVPSASAPGDNRHARRAKQAQARRQIVDVSGTIAAPISLTWTDHLGVEHGTRVLLRPQGMLEFEGTQEADLQSCHMFAAQAPTAPEEAASHYSAIQRRREIETFRRSFFSVFNEITDVVVDQQGGAGTLLVDVPWAKELIPLPLFSGGTTRTAAVLLAIAFKRDGLLLLDEAESGIYHARQASYAKALIQLARDYQTQVVMTTHSDEWLRNFLSAVEEKDEDISFWRMERNKEGLSRLRPFTVKEFTSGLSMGEMR